MFTIKNKKKTEARKRRDKKHAKPASVAILVLIICSFMLSYGVELYLISTVLLLSIAYSYYTGVMMDFITVSKVNMLIRRKKDPKYFDSLVVFYIIIIILANYLNLQYYY